MLMVLDCLVFAGAAATGGYAIVATVAPDLAKIRAVLSGEAQRFAPLGTLVLAERRIAVRRWSGTSRAGTARFREAA